MPTAKEREILEKQRRLAALMKPSMSSSQKPPPKTKPVKKDAVIDLTDSASKRPPEPSAKRPSLKRPKAGSKSQILAAARAKASQPPPPATVEPANGKPSPRLKRKTMGETGALKLSKLVHDMGKEPSSTVAFKEYTPDDFWKNLRAWDIPSSLYHQQLEQQGSLPETYQITKKPICETFLNARHYCATWAPLLLSECRAQLLQELTTRMTAPVLVEVKVTESGPRNRHQGSAHMLTDSHTSMDPPSEGYVTVYTRERNVFTDGFMANDIVLLIQTPYRHVLRDILRGNAVPLDATCDPSSAFSGISLVGHTEVSRRELNGLCLKVSKRKWTTNGKKDMYLVKVGANVTAQREFASLCSVDRLPMRSFLFGQHLERFENRRKLSRNQSKEALLQQMGGELLGDGFLEYAGAKFNHSQLTAIAAAAHEYGEGGFTLIKGPPGTGSTFSIFAARSDSYLFLDVETTTLVAVLNSLHIRQYNKYYDEVRRIATRPRESALSGARSAKPRLLVCAPSNAAIDNIILKIMEDGFIDGQGRRYNPSMIRVGVGQSNAVRDVSLENKVDAIFSEYSDADQLQTSILGYKGELQRITREITGLRQRIQAINTACPYNLSEDWEIRIDEDQFDQLRKAYFVNHKTQQTTYEVPSEPRQGESTFRPSAMPEFRAYAARIVKLVENYFSIKTQLERCSIIKGSMDLGANPFQVRLNLEENVLNTVHMVMTTLGSAGGRALEGADRFEVVVVDEAAQSVEMSALAALRLGSKHSVLVGDPQQLPATIFNLPGRNSKYDRSLFQRLEEAGQPVYMLNEQYRMHPKISHFPRNIFYKGALKDGPNVCQPGYGNPLGSTIYNVLPNLSPLTILDLDSQEERGGTSLSNLSEAKLAVYLFDQLNTLSRGLASATKVAIITPYAEQKKVLTRQFSEHLGPRFESMVDVNTVDAFQVRVCSTCA